MTVLAGLRDRFLPWLKPIHRGLRRKKVDLFLRLVGDSAEDTLLDVGGGPGVEGEFLSLYACFHRVVVINLDTEHLEAQRHCCFSTIRGDARRLPFSSQSFDWVFSNAVIEHVGRWKDQMQFADEIRRVAIKGYFVTTPNKLFPLEPHTLLPFYQFLPNWMRRKLAPYSPGYLKRYERIELLSSKQVQKLFPEATVVSTGFPVFGNSLVAFHSKR